MREHIGPLPDDDDDDLNPSQAIIIPKGVYSESARLKASLKQARDLYNTDVSRFRVGKAYRLKEDKTLAFLIAELGPVPMSRLPAGYGLLVNPQGNPVGRCFLLTDLAEEVLF